MTIVGVGFFKFFKFLGLPMEWALGEDTMKKIMIAPTSPFGTFPMVIQVSLFGGLVLAMPFVVYFVIKFVAPGLTRRERGMLRPALFAAVVLFALGASGCFFIMLPAGLRAVYKLNTALGFTTLWNATDYYSIVAWGVFGMGLIFEFPLLLVVLQTLGIIETKTLKRWRKIALIVILIGAGLVAPSPDPVSMLMVAAPMLIMYEGSLIVGAWTRKRRLAQQARKEAEEAANNAG